MFNLFSSPVKKGIELIEQNKYDEAVKFLTDLVAKKPDLAEGFLYLGKSYYYLQDIEKAKKCLHKALELKNSPDIIKEIISITNWQMISSVNYFNSYPSFSSDGKKILYVSAREGGIENFMLNSLQKAGVYITDLATGIETRVVSENYINLFPVFSPDNKKILFLSYRSPISNTKEANNPALYIKDLETGVEKKLLDETYRIKYPSFFPDGKKIIYSSWHKGNKNSGIYSLDIETGKNEVLVDDTYECAFPSVNFDGTKILYTSWRKDTNGDGIIDIRDNSGIYMKDLTLGKEFYIVSDDYKNMFPTFSIDGEKIVYLSLRKDTNNDGKIDSFDNCGVYMYDFQKKKEIYLVEDTYYNKFPYFMSDNETVTFISNKRSPEEIHKLKGYFEFKGIYSVNIKSRNIEKIVSEEFYGNRSLVVSPTQKCIAYVSWRQDTARGLYVAYLDALPTPEELHKWIDTNI